MRSVFDKGVTLLEILIAVALLLILLIYIFTGWRLQIGKARDADRSADLDTWAKALIVYQEDHGCYPEETDMACGSTFLAPYLSEVPCDPVSNQDYRYVYTKVDCNTFYIYTKFENLSDDKIAQVGCTGGCGPEGQSTSFDYFVSSTNTSVESDDAGVPPTCGGAIKYCFPNVCSTCCPGVFMRCSPSGKLCVQDNSCSN